jgi:Plasmid encoded RepA protein
MSKKSLSTKSINALVEEVLAIESEQAQDAGKLGFMCRAMVQASLPSRKTEGSEFTRQNGNFTLTMLAPSSIGLPYGTVPRLLLTWLATEAVKTRERELVLGDTLSSFMRELGMTPTGGRWGSIPRLKDQSRRLFAATITGFYEDEERTAMLSQQIADHANLWWDNGNPEQAGLWKSTVKLSESFFNEVINNPVPVDLRAVKVLQRSPLALDIYAWLTYRLSYLRNPTLIPWPVLEMQFGANYKLTRQFKAAFIEHLATVITVYPGARVEATDKGLKLMPSPPHIAKQSTTSRSLTTG